MHIRVIIIVLDMAKGTHPNILLNFPYRATKNHFTKEHTNTSAHYGDVATIAAIDPQRKNTKYSFVNKIY